MPLREQCSGAGAFFLPPTGVFILCTIQQAIFGVSVLGNVGLGLEFHDDLSQYSLDFRGSKCYHLNSVHFLALKGNNQAKCSF
jgi:hypothetical protein